MCPAPATARTRFSSPRRTWSCGTRRPQTDVHSIGIYTLPEMEFPFATMDDVVREIRRVAASWSAAASSRSCSAASIRSPPAGGRRASPRQYPDLSVLQIDAHADLRDSLHGDAAQPRLRDAPRRSTCAPTTQVGIRSLSPEEAAAAPTLATKIFYDFNMRQDPDWIDRVVESLSDTVYITIDVDGLDPAIMPAIGTPEPGGLSWYEALRAAAPRHRAADRSSAATSWSCRRCAGNVAPNFLCAKLIYKILSYRFGAEVKGRSSGFMRVSSCSPRLRGERRLRVLLDECD